MSCSQWQWWRKWAKITRAIPETFQSKDVPACSTLQQFNTVFRSNVVIVLGFSLNTVILNDQVEERITWQNVFFLPACVFLCLCVDVCTYGNVQFMCLYMFVWNHTTVYTHPNIQYINTELKNKDKVIKTENRKVSWTFRLIIRWLVSESPPSPSRTNHMLKRAVYTLCLYLDCLTLTETDTVQKH